MNEQQKKDAALRKEMSAELRKLLVKSLGEAGADAKMVEMEKLTRETLAEKGVLFSLPVLNAMVEGMRLYANFHATSPILADMLCVSIIAMAEKMQNERDAIVKKAL